MCLRKKVYCLHRDRYPLLIVVDVPECKGLTPDDIRRAGLGPVTYEEQLTEITQDTDPILLQALQKPGAHYGRVTYERLEELIRSVVDRIAR